MPVKFPITKLTEAELKIFNSIRKLLSKGRFLVGGFVRDLFLGVERKKIDFDIISPEAEKDASILAEAFHSMLVRLDEDFRIYRVPLSGDKYIDIAQLQGEELKDDLYRRDFTINAICVGLDSLEVIDLLGGLNDINKRQLRVCSEGAFLEDPLRIIRAFSLAAQFDLNWDRSVRYELERAKNSLKYVKAERINQELLRLFASGDSYRWFYYMYKTGILSILIPEVTMMEGLYQGPYHHLDVLSHSFETLKKLEQIINKLKYVTKIKKRDFLLDYLSESIGSWRRASLLKWVAFWHDIGKPLSKQELGGRVVFYGHNISGAKLIADIMRRLKFSRRQIRFVHLLVKLHLRPGDLTKDGVTEKAVYRFFRQSEGEELAVLLLSWADAWATRGRLNPWVNFYLHRRGLIKMINKAIELRTSPKLEKLVNGYDVMRILKIDSGPEVGKILEQVRELQVLGEIVSREQALEYVRKYSRSLLNS